MLRATSVGLTLAVAIISSALVLGQYETDKIFITIPSWDGTILSADVHIPRARVADEKFPVVIFANSWFSPEFEYLVEAVKLAEEGYLVLEYETRGWPGSGGEISAAGPHEQKDTITVIDYTLGRKDWPAESSKLALAGISYGAGLALIGAAQDERVTTAVAMSGWATMKQALFHNDSPNLVWGKLLLDSGKLGGHLDPIVPAMWTQVLAGNVTAIDLFAANRSVENIAEAFVKRPVPLFLSSNMEDRLFEGEDMINFFEKHPGPKKLLLNQGIHATAEIGGLVGLPFNHVWLEVKAWLDQYLRGAPAPSKDPLVDVQLRSDKFMREHFFEWPSQRLAALEFSLGPRGRGRRGSLLQPSMAADAASDTISFAMKTGYNAGFPIIGSVLQVFVDRRIKTSLPSTSQQHAIWYYTKLQRETRVCGTPVLNLDFTPSSSKFQIVAYLWSVNWLNTGTLISHGTVSCWNCTAGQRITRKFQLRTLCEDIKGGLGIGLDMFSELYQPANTASDLTLTFHYSNASSLTVPEVLAGATTSEFSLVV